MHILNRAEKKFLLLNWRDLDFLKIWVVLDLYMNIKTRDWIKMLVHSNKRLVSALVLGGIVLPKLLFKKFGVIYTSTIDGNVFYHLHQLWVLLNH